jgi:hypothetical protein
MPVRLLAYVVGYLAREWPVSDAGEQALRARFAGFVGARPPGKLGRGFPDDASLRESQRTEGGGRGERRASARNIHSLLADVAAASRAWASVCGHDTVAQRAASPVTWGEHVTDEEYDAADF